MKKSLLVISMMLAFAIALGGCATKGDLEEVEAREKAIGAKADQAAQDAQEAKAAADEAVVRANEAAARAEEAVKNAKSGQVRFRNDKNGIVHGTIGRVGFTKDQLSENLTVLTDELKKLKPAGAKGVYLKSAHLSSTFGPGLKINISSFV